MRGMPGKKILDLAMTPGILVMRKQDPVEWSGMMALFILMANAFENAADFTDVAEALERDEAKLEKLAGTIYDSEKRSAPRV